jgi:hypothetical protein
VVTNSVFGLRFRGGISAYRAQVPNDTFCTDGSLTRVGFMDPRDVEIYVDQVRRQMGLTAPVEGIWIDLAVVDQFSGPTMPAPWLEYGPVDGVKAAWLAGEEPRPLAAPARWIPSDSSPMTRWTPGPHGTVVSRREAEAPELRWEEPQYSARTFDDPTDELPTSDRIPEPSAPAAKKRKRKKRELRRINDRQARRAIYIDFEGRAVAGEPPILLGYCIDEEPSPEPRVRQFLLDRGLDPLLTLTPTLVPASIEEAVTEIIRISDQERRHLISWSLHDRRVIREWTHNQSFRYRSAIPTARRWRRGRTSLKAAGEPVQFDDHNLQSYLSLIGFVVPDDLKAGAGEWISTVRQRLLGVGGDASQLSKGGRDAWRKLIEHNRLDVLGMRAVVRISVGLEEVPLGNLQD